MLELGFAVYEDLALSVGFLAVELGGAVGGGWRSVAEAYLTSTSIIMRGRREEDLVPLPNGFIITQISKNLESKKKRQSFR